MDEVFSTEMTGICQNILTDVQSQHKQVGKLKHILINYYFDLIHFQCKQAGQDIQANVVVMTGMCLWSYLSSHLAI